MKSKNNILIIGWFKFPFGSAGASRVRTIAKGLTEKGVKVHIITTARIPLRPEDQTSSGFFWEGIAYETQNIYEEAGEKLPKFRRLWNYVGATLMAWKRVIELHQAEEFDSILIYGRSAISYLPIVLISSFYKISLFYDIVKWFPRKKFRYGAINPCFYAVIRR